MTITTRPRERDEDWQRWTQMIRTGLYGGTPYKASGIAALNELVAWLESKDQA